VSPVPRDLARNYRVAYLRSLAGPHEGALSDGYSIGRAAVEQGVSLLEVAELHHEGFLAALRDTPPDDVADVATASSAFLLEVLAAYDMAQRTLFRPESDRPD
jgi:Phosphoserine phosphatase RsbU, N-terminal domain